MLAKLAEENLDRAIQPRLVVPGDRDREVAIDEKLTIARLHLCRQGHEIQGLRRLRLNHGCEGHAQHYRQDNPHDSLSPLLQSDDCGNDPKMARIRQHSGNCRRGATGLMEMVDP